MSNHWLAVRACEAWVSNARSVNYSVRTEEGDVCSWANNDIPDGISDRYVDFLNYNIWRYKNKNVCGMFKLEALNLCSITQTYICYKKFNYTCFIYSSIYLYISVMDSVNIEFVLCIGHNWIIFDIWKKCLR